jgi:hypothetical protein
MSGSALRNLDSGSEHWFRERRIGSRARRDGWSEHHARTDDLSRKHESALGHHSADTPELPVPTLESLPTPTALHGNRRTARRRQAQPHRGRKLLGLPPRHQCPTTSHQTISHQTMAPMGGRPRHLRSSGIQSAKFSAGSSVVRSEQRNSCTSCRMTRTNSSTYAAEPGF